MNEHDQSNRTADATARLCPEMVSDAAAADVTEADEQEGLLAQVLAARREASALRQALGTMVAAMHCADLALRDRMMFAALPRARELVGGSPPEWKPSGYRFVRNSNEVVAGARVYQNDHYTANVYPENAGVIHISFSRRDGGHAVDWRDKQHMKNQLIGTENEAVEIFPAESRKADGANQFHLWALADPKARFPIGFVGRLVSDASSLPGVRQRPGSGATPEDEAESRRQEEAFLKTPAGSSLKRIAGEKP